MFHSERSNSHFLLGMIVGGTIGAASTYLFKTKEGKRLQQEIMERYEEFSKQAHTYIKPKMAKIARRSRKTRRKKR